jgi:hypothetical protein
MQTRGVHWFPPSNSRKYLALGIVTAVGIAIDNQFYRIVFRASYVVTVPIALAAAKKTQPTASSLPTHVNKLVRAVIHEFLSVALGPRSEFITLQLQQLKNARKPSPAVPFTCSPASDKELLSPWSQWLLSELWRSFFTTVEGSKQQLQARAQAQAQPHRHSRTCTCTGTGTGTGTVQSLFSLHTLCAATLMVIGGARERTYS